MKYFIFRLACVLLFTFALTTYCIAQENKKASFSLKSGAGNSIATRSFFTEGPDQSVPHAAFVHVVLSADIHQKENRSLYFGIEMQGLNFYPAYNQKEALSSASVLLGESRKINLSNSFYLKQTNAMLLNCLLDVSSFQPDVSLYTGNPFKNLNVGAVSSLQLLLSTAKKKNYILDYGLGLDFAFRGIQLYTNKSFPAYLRHNPFIQYGMNLNMSYTF